MSVRIRFLHADERSHRRHHPSGFDSEEPGPNMPAILSLRFRSLIPVLKYHSEPERSTFRSPIIDPRRKALLHNI
jgi:hypothetical protein